MSCLERNDQNSMASGVKGAWMTTRIYAGTVTIEQNRANLRIGLPLLESRRGSLTLGLKLMLAQPEGRWERVLS